MQEREREKSAFKRPASQLIRARKGQSSERREREYQMNKLKIDKGRKGKSNEVKEQLDNQKEPNDIKQKEGKTGEEPYEKIKPKEGKRDDGKGAINQLKELLKMKLKEYAEVNQPREFKQIKFEEESINYLSQIIQLKEKAKSTEPTIITRTPSEPTSKETPLIIPSLQENFNETHNNLILQPEITMELIGKLGFIEELTWITDLKDLKEEQLKRKKSSLLCLISKQNWKWR